MVCLFGWGVSITPYCLICLDPSGSLHHWRAWRHSSLRFASYCTLAISFLGDKCSLGRCSSLGELPGFLERLVTSALICTGCFGHPLHRTVTYIAARLIGASLEPPVLLCRLFDGASMARLLYFRSSDRIRRSVVLSNSRPSSLRLADVAGPVADMSRQRRRGKVLV